MSTFWIEQRGRSRIIMRLDLQVNDEASFFATNQELATSFVEYDYRDQAHWHTLLIHRVQVLIKDNEFEVPGAGKVQVVPW